MLRRLAAVVMVLALASGCAGSSKLSQKSEEKLAKGDAWRAWQLAVRALEKEPGNPRARAAATAAGTSIVEEWQREIRALAQTDSLRAADQVLELTEFRTGAARYATIPVGAEWPREEAALRRTAARYWYMQGIEAADSGRPKKAYAEFTRAQRFETGYRDVAARVDRAYDEALTRVAVVPFRAPSADPSLGVQVARAWRDTLAESLLPPATEFTRIVGGDAITERMTVRDLEDLSRKEAIRLGRQTAADRVVWGSVGDVRASTRLQFFRDTVARRVTVKGPDGRESVEWVEVPIEVVSRVRDVNVGADYEIIATASGASIARRHVDRSTSARVVWTSYQPIGDPSTYALVSETVRATNPDRAKDVEARWKAVCGAGTTLVQVLEARRKAGSSGHDAREALPRFAMGAAFVFLEELPPAEDLALQALAQGSAPLREDLVRLDDVDDVDLGAEAPGRTAR
jgi:hypothetical protein